MGQQLMMTRKDYVATAEILNKMLDKITVAQEEAFDEMVMDFVNMFENDNERFLSSRFIDACYEEAE
jgi:hypothetical protein